MPANHVRWIGAQLIEAVGCIHALRIVHVSCVELIPQSLKSRSHNPSRADPTIPQEPIPQSHKSRSHNPTRADPTIPQDPIPQDPIPRGHRSPSQHPTSTRTPTPAYALTATPTPTLTSAPTLTPTPLSHLAPCASDAATLIWQGDIKPANILFRRDGYVALTDYGMRVSWFEPNPAPNPETQACAVYLPLRRTCLPHLPLPVRNCVSRTGCVSRIGNHQPPTTLHLPPTTLHLPPTTLHLPPMTLHLPPTTLHLPPMTLHLPPMTLHLPPMTLHLPPMTLHLPPMTLHLPPTTLHPHVSPPATPRKQVRIRRLGSATAARSRGLCGLHSA